MKTHHIIQGATVAVFLVLLIGCREEDKYQLRFSHYLHVTENEMACDECHGEPGQPSFNAITHDTCIDCHEEPEAEEITMETCGLCHQEKQVTLFLLPEPAEEELPDASAAADTSSRNIFVHTEALADQCADCHEALLDEALESVPMLKRGDILSMREAAHGSGQDCLTCHVDMDRAQAPANHDVAWMKRHGAFGMQDDAACSVCHSEDSCTECHSVMQPVSHNNLWRMRSHGAAAAWNRASCQVCHEEDSCSSCHAENRPRSHTARWEENHCYGCHTATPAGEGCVVCHEEGNNVLLHQSFWPPVHDFFGNQANCYDCHNPYE